jgi:WD40 repeat protein
MASIFISHSHLGSDNETAAKLAEWLRENGWGDVYVDFDTQGGEDWIQRIRGELRDCRVVLFVKSENSLSSQWCFGEALYGWARGRRLIPLAIDDSKTERPPITSHQAIDFREVSFDPASDSAPLRHLAEILTEILNPSDALSWDSSRRPFVGLDPFDRQDAGVFFGRDPLIQEGLRTLDASRITRSTPFVLVRGAPKSGKSSFIQAGLVARIARRPGDWVVIEACDRTGACSLDALSRGIEDALAAHGQPVSREEIRLELGRPNAISSLLRPLLDESSGEPSATILLVVDSLDEVVRTSSDPNSVGLLDRLFEAVESRDVPVTVLAALDTDLPQPLDGRGGSNRIANLRVDVLGGEAVARDLLTKTLTKAKQDTDSTSALVDTFVDAFGSDPGILPLMFAIATLWPTTSGDGKYELIGGRDGLLAAFTKQVIPGVSGVSDDAIHEALVSLLDIRDGSPVCIPAPKATLPSNALRLLSAVQILRSDGPGDTVQLIDDIARCSSQWPAAKKALDGVRRAQQRKRLKTAAIAATAAAVVISVIGWLVKSHQKEAALNQVNQWTLEAFDTVSRCPDDALEKLRRAARFATDRSIADAELPQWLLAARHGLSQARLLQEPRRVDGVVTDRSSGDYLAIEKVPGDADGRKRCITLRNPSHAKTIPFGEPVDVNPKACFAGRHGEWLLGSAGSTVWWCKRSDCELEVKVKSFDDAIVTAIACSPADDLVALQLERLVPDEVYSFRLSQFRLGSGTEERVLPLDQQVQQLRFSPDGGVLALVGKADNRLRLWFGDEAAPRLAEFAHDRGVHDVDFGAGEFVLTASADRTAIIWDAMGRKVHTIENPSQAPFSRAVFSADDRWIATADFNGEIRLLRRDDDAWRPQRSLHLDDKRVTALSFSSGGRFLFSGSARGTVRVFEVDSGLPVSGWQAAGRSCGREANGSSLIRAVDLPDNGRMQVVTGDEVQWIDPGTTDVPLPHTSSVRSAAWEPGGRKIATGTDTGDVFIWSATSGDRLATTPAVHTDPTPPQITSLDWSADLLVAGRSDGIVDVWHRAGSPKQRQLGPVDLCGAAARAGDAEACTDHGVLRVAFEPGTTTYAVVTQGGVVRRFDRTEEAQPPFRLGSENARSVAVGARHIAIGGAAGTIALIDTDSNIELRRWQAHTSQVRALRFSPDHTELLSGGSDKMLRLWSVADTRTPVERELFSTVRAVSFSSDGNWIAAGTASGKVGVFAREKLEQAATFSHPRQVNAVAFTPAAARDVTKPTLLSGSADHTARLIKAYQYAPFSEVRAEIERRSGLAAR